MQVADNRERRVVIVDDSRTMQAMLESVLEPCRRFKVVGIASDAPSAVKMIDQLNPDVVTIDFCMPYIDGAALLEQLSDRGNICKIVVSDRAAGNAAMVTKLRNSGAAACIAKTELAASPGAFRTKLQAIVDAFETSGAFTRSLPSHDDVAITPNAHINMRASVFGYPIPTDERQRLEYIRRKQLANLVPERQFDLLTRHLAQLSAFPICLMTFIDRDTQWSKASYGLPSASASRCEAFCNYTIAQDDTFIVRNAANDRAFANNPKVTGDPHIRTYVGHPIITDEGIHVGALCVIDTQVRFVPQVLVARVKALAEIAAEMINRRPMMAA